MKLRLTKYKIKAHLLPRYREVMDCSEGAPVLNPKGGENSLRQKEG